ncbi:MAG: metallophosphoesterase [Intrasporangiaceae bacterium]|nr:metallophosphoesterase [Intrasporangiaceae bacterium]
MITLAGLGKTGGALTALGAAGLLYAGVIERNWFALRRFDVPVLPHGSRPLRILQVSDLHFVPGQERKARWVRDLARLRPDLVINSGDNLSHMEAVPPVLRALAPLMDFPGAFVLGSNDVYAPNPKNPARYLTRNYSQNDNDRRLLPVAELTGGMRAAGWLDLNNTRSLIDVAGLPLELVGVDDPHIQLDRYEEVAGPASPDAALTIGLTHAPYQRVLDAMTADGADLIIAGHTHGGQLAVPGMGAVVTNCDLDRGRAKGLSRWWPGAGVHRVERDRLDDRPGISDVSPWVSRASTQPQPDDAAYLHVSAGLGTSRFAPVRFACRPEATLLTLVPRP